MAEKPEALRLADVLDRSVLAVCADAAAELRRLYAVNQELLEALKLADRYCPPNSEAEILVRAAIAQPETQPGPTVKKLLPVQGEPSDEGGINSDWNACMFRDQCRHNAQAVLALNKETKNDRP